MFFIVAHKFFVVLTEKMIAEFDVFFLKKIGEKLQCIPVIILCKFFLNNCINKALLTLSISSLSPVEEQSHVIKFDGAIQSNNVVFNDFSSTEVLLFLR